MDNLLLNVEDLQIKFKTTNGIIEAVKNISFTIFKGESIGIIGESGCGKSVTAMSILKLLHNNSIIDGKLNYYNKDKIIDINKLNSNSKDLKDIRSKHISMIFQEPMTSFGPMHTIGNQINESVKLKYGYTASKSQEITLKLLKKVKIPNPKLNINSYPHQISGWMRQRAMIAMALACSPDLLIADEPTTALDVTIQSNILNLISELRKESQMSIMFISHNLGVVNNICDRIYVMYMGKIIEEGNSYDLFKTPLHPYTKGLIKSIPSLKDNKTKRLYSIKGHVPDKYKKYTGCVFSDRCNDFMKGKCDIIEPNKIKINKNQFVSCFLYK